MGKLLAANVRSGAAGGGHGRRDLAAGAPEVLVFDQLGAAVYAIDQNRALIYYNRAAVRLWGRAPQIGDPGWFGSWRLFDSAGERLGADDYPTARVIRDHQSIAGEELIAERPDGERIPLLAYATPLFDAAGGFVGATNILVEIAGRKSAEAAAQQLAAVVESSDDAILTKDLCGVITSWNEGASRIFGYSAQEAVGQPVTMLIPPDRQDEEPLILDRIRQGERIDHYETVRRRKDGSLIDISLTVSPLKTPAGRIIGASKIARDVTERRRAQSQQALLVREMSHRIKNLFALAGGVVSLSARSAKSVGELTAAVRTRLAALARAHALTLNDPMQDQAAGGVCVSLHELTRAIISPYERADGAVRFEVRGSDPPLSGQVLSSFALLMHEFATNAVKYGALSVPEGRVVIDCGEAGDRFTMVWREIGGPPVTPPNGDGDGGFGSVLARSTAQGQLGGQVEYDWRPEGLVIRLCANRRLLAGG